MALSLAIMWAHSLFMYRELAADGTMASKHAQVYKVMKASLALPKPSQGRLPPSLKRPSSSGPPAIIAAEDDTGALLRDIGGSKKYTVLHDLLQGKQPETILAAVCALTALLQPPVAGL